VQRLGITRASMKGARDGGERPRSRRWKQAPLPELAPKQWHKGINRSNGNFLDFRESIRHEATVKAAK
jgi:hypothetical protein